MRRLKKPNYINGYMIEMDSNGIVRFLITSTKTRYTLSSRFTYKT
jgi:hypothetical protein